MSSSLFRSTILRRASPFSRSASTEATTEKAKSAISGAVGSAQGIAKSIGDRASGLLGAYKEPVLGNAAVAREFVKQVYVAEKLSPPSISQFQSTYASFYQSARDLSFWKQLYESGQWKKVAIYAVEAYGIFKIGEMIGRRHIVGYKLEEPKPAHH